MIEFIPAIVPPGLVNGKLNACQLEPVFCPGAGHKSMGKTAARAFKVMQMVCDFETKRTLSSTGIYRDYTRQVSMFNERMTRPYNPVTCSTITRTWNGVRYWLRRGMAPCATPGTSNHGYGIAVDVAWWRQVTEGGKTFWKLDSITADPVGWKWVQDNAVSFGFSWEGARPGEKGWEPWHLRYVLGEKVSPRVADAEAAITAAMAGKS